MIVRPTGRRNVSVRSLTTQIQPSTAGSLQSGGQNRAKTKGTRRGVGMGLRHHLEVATGSREHRASTLLLKIPPCALRRRWRKDIGRLRGAIPPFRKVRDPVGLHMSIMVKWPWPRHSQHAECMLNILLRETVCAWQCLATSSKARYKLSLRRSASSTLESSQRSEWTA